MQKMRDRLVVSAKAGTALILGTVLLNITPAQAAEPTPEQIEQGREIYDGTCATCHGRDMAAPGAVVFDLRTFPKDGRDRFKNAVLNGKGVAMPAWRDKLSDEDIELLWAYVRGGP